LRWLRASATITVDPVPERDHPAPEPAVAPAPRAPEPAAAALASRPPALDRPGLLRLQRGAGNAAIGRLLARQPTTLPPLADPARDDPFDISEEEWKQIEATAARHHAEHVGDVRQRILDLLDGPDRLQLLSRMRELAPGDRSDLQKDPAFQQAIRKRFRGFALWAIELTLEYGPRRPAEVDAVSAAIHGGEWARTRQLLMAYPTLRTVPGIRQVIAGAFSGRQAEDLAAVLAEGAGDRAQSGVRHSTEVHYEKGVLVQPGGDAIFELVRIGNQLRVIVRIGLQEDPKATTTAIKDADVARWEDGIKRIWNGRFRLRSGAQALDVYFLPIFVFHDPSAHHTVTVVGAKARSAQSTWHATDSGVVAAHEFGHMLGTQDEYGLPGTMAEVPASVTISPDDLRRSSWEGIFGVKRPKDTKGYDVEGLMGQHGKSTAVETRHLWDVLQVFNAQLRRPGEAEWTAEKR
jgi:hypothetical protein